MWKRRGALSAGLAESNENSELDRAEDAPDATRRASRVPRGA